MPPVFEVCRLPNKEIFPPLPKRAAQPNVTQQTLIFHAILGSRHLVFPASHCSQWRAAILGGQRLTTQGNHLFSAILFSTLCLPLWLAGSDSLADLQTCRHRVSSHKLTFIGSSGCNRYDLATEASSRSMGMKVTDNGS